MLDGFLCDVLSTSGDCCYLLLHFLQLKIHGTCPGELEDVVRQLEQATGSVVVGKIGRTVILYRPSLSKLKAEEKKKLVQRAILKKQMLNKDKKPVQVFSS